MLTVVDEYSRFPYAFSCSSMDANTVITCLSELFAMFGICSTPSYARVRMANDREASVSHRDVAPIRDRCECNRTDLTESDNDFVSCDCASSSLRNQAQNLRAQTLLSVKPVIIILFLSLTTLCLLLQNLLVPDVQLVLVVLPNALRMIATTFVHVKFCA